MLKHIHRGLWLTAGLLFLLLGVIGLLLPLVPQLPFFLLSLVCFMRCSRRLNAWIERQPWFIRLRTRLHSRRGPKV